ncbi:Sugar kinase of the NBD/HSP70 family, may contain an N-terminal HTH domain [Pedobacter westerhofensis]|uniref:Sugar kinase of the NBD/HSP70 family, may contain an N-terminal HTH domain n=2 Tax=Pedobacter westerhofensis TaxID=425512 RepID=A0A521FQ25_9SPHI|nr:Sugar kinase of the NBD/HSP70 family, may contain an N-terminal HTH domain [Pedobacter westerhofensis]
MFSSFRKKLTMSTLTLTLSDAHLSIIKAIYFNRLVSSLEISKVTGASIPTITKHIEELISGGWIVEKGFAQSTSGRRPVVYSLVSDRNYILSVAMDQFYTRMVIADLSGTFVTEIAETEINLNDDPSALEKLIADTNTFIENSGIQRGKIFAAGISMPGFVDVQDGNNRSFLHTEEITLRDKLTQDLGLPVFIDNDSSVIALAELKFGIGKTNSEAMVINLSWGIGLGMIINNKIYRGFKGYAGEFSHIPIFDNDKICSCGKRGCLETQASLITIEDSALEEINNGAFTSLKIENGKVEITAVIAEAMKGDSLSIKLLSYAGYQIGRAIAILIHILNPEKIVLSGRASKAGKFLLPPVQQAINDYSIPTITEGTEIIISKMGFDAQLVGSAALAIEHISKEFFV